MTVKTCSALMDSHIGVKSLRNLGKCQSDSLLSSCTAVLLINFCNLPLLMLCDPGPETAHRFMCGFKKSAIM